MGGDQQEIGEPLGEGVSTFLPWMRLDVVAGRMLSCTRSLEGLGQEPPRKRCGRGRLDDCLGSPSSVVGQGWLRIWDRIASDSPML